jgi:signal transduction histidine kinase
MDVRSLRGKLGLFYAAALFVALMLFAIGTIAIEHQLRSASFDDRIETATRALIAITASRDGRLVAVGIDTARFSRIVGSRLNGAIVARDRGVVMSSVTTLPPQLRALAAAPPPVTALRTVVIDGQPFRVGITPVPRLASRLGVALIWQNFAGIAEIDRRLEVIFALAIPLLVAFAFFAGNLVAARGLQPLQSLATVASAIEAHDLSQRLTVPPTRDELGLLCATFNRMLDRLEDAFERERRFTSDASHELRAPLAVILAESDLTLRRVREPAEYERALRTISTQVGRLEALTRDLLAEARAESAVSGGSGDPVELGEVVGEVADTLAPLVRARGIALAVTLDDEVFASSASAALRRAVTCVVHNAVKFARRSVRVTVHADRTAGTGIVTVADDGPGFSEDGLDHATERFWRDPRTRSLPTVADLSGSGTGLGLAIAAAIVESARGTLHVENHPSGGAAVTIVLPLAQTKTADASRLDASAASSSS